jgi:hypothetical protein
MVDLDTYWRVEIPSHFWTCSLKVEYSTALCLVDGDRQLDRRSIIHVIEGVKRRRLGTGGDGSKEVSHGLLCVLSDEGHVVLDDLSTVFADDCSIK